MTDRITPVLSATIPAVAAAVDDSTVFGEVSFAGTVTSVTYTPEAAITGAATNHRAIRLRNRGAAGTGTTVIAELAFDAGVNAAAFDEVTIPLTATVANRAIAEGDILEVFSDSIGTGLADPGGVVQVAIGRS